MIETIVSLVFVVGFLSVLGVAFYKADKRQAQEKADYLALVARQTLALEQIAKDNAN